jgi:hypothetical protein
MSTLDIEIKKDLAMRELTEIEKKELSEILMKEYSISSLRRLVKKPMTNAEIDAQLNKLRNEWERDI